MSVLDQIKELEAQKQQLLADAKKEALQAAQKAIDTLNELGFNYQLVEAEGASVVTPSSRSRRTGVREDIIDLLKQNTNGLSRADIIEQMGAKGDKSFEQSISNTLSTSKKKGAITLEDGIYTLTGATTYKG